MSRLRTTVLPSTLVISFDALCSLSSTGVVIQSEKRTGEVLVMGNWSRPVQLPSALLDSLLTEVILLAESQMPPSLLELSSEGGSNG